MRARVGIISVALFAFLIVLLLRFPLSWVRPLLPASISCEQPSGSIWQGRCGSLSVNAAAGPLPIGPVSWNLQSTALLRARLVGTVRVDGPQLRGQAAFDAGTGGSLRVRDVNATAPIDKRLLGMVPSNWTGRLVLRFSEIELRGGELLALAGTLDALDVVAQGPSPDEFGSHSVSFAGAKGTQVHHGVLRDLGGPLELTGTVDVRRNLDWEFAALVKARANATPQLVRLLEYLGPPDEQGRRRFAAAGDF